MGAYGWGMTPSLKPSDPRVARKAGSLCSCPAFRQQGVPQTGSLTHTPAIAQLVEHLTVDICSYQMVPGLIPGGRTFGQTDRHGQLKEEGLGGDGKGQ